MVELNPCLKKRRSLILSFIYEIISLCLFLIFQFDMVLKLHFFIFSPGLPTIMVSDICATYVLLFLTGD